MVRTVTFFIAVAMVSCVGVGAAHTFARPSVLADCQGRPLEKPASVVLTCADAGIIVNDIAWTGWGESFAAGRGVATVNDCEPNCASGRFHRFDIVLLAEGREACPDGRTAYARIEYGWLGRSPYPTDAPGTARPLIPFRCGR